MRFLLAFPDRARNRISFGEQSFSNYILQVLCNHVNKIIFHNLMLSARLSFTLLPLGKYEQKDVHFFKTKTTVTFFTV